MDYDPLMYDMSTTKGIAYFVDDKCTEVCMGIGELALEYVRNLLAVGGKIIGNPADMTPKQILDSCNTMYNGDFRGMLATDDITNFVDEHLSPPPNMSYIVHAYAIQQLATILLESVSECSNKDDITCAEIDNSFFQNDSYRLLDMFDGVIPPQSLVRWTPIVCPPLKVWSAAGSETREYRLDTALEEWCISANVVADDEDILRVLRNGIRHIVRLMLNTPPLQMDLWLRSIPCKPNYIGGNLVNACRSKIFNLVMDDVYRAAGNRPFITYNQVIHGFMNNSVFDLAPYMRNSVFDMEAYKSAKPVVDKYGCLDLYPLPPNVVVTE